jgi:hypothetical protein
MTALAGFPRKTKDPFLILSYESGTGGALVFHMSAIESRFNISEWNTWKLSLRTG